MGCCGCSNKSSAITAGIFGLIQGLVGIIFNAYFINLYTSYGYYVNLDNLDERIFLVYATRDAEPIILILLAVATILHGMWILSSITLLIGNANDNTCCIRQWVVWTSFVIIGDIILPIILALCTFGSFADVVNSMNAGVQSSMGRDNSLENYGMKTVSRVTLDFYQYYILLLISFSKLGLITIIVNICLNVFTNRRAYEINNPRGYVMGTTVTIIQGQPSVPGMIQIGPNTVLPQPPVVYNSNFPQDGRTNPYYAGNIPLQPAVSFLSDPATGIPYPENNEAGGICNPLSEPLLPPKYKNEC